ncbi:unnamed protein product [Leuciscus chuanchicus]
MAYLNEKYADQVTDDLLDVATLVDPRFKAQYIKPDKVEAIKTRALAEMMDDYQGQPQAETLDETEPTGAEGGIAAEPPTPLGMKKQRKSLSSFFKKQSPSADALPLTERQKVQSELESYLMCPDADSESEPLEWWRLHERNFPRVSKLAKKYLCIPATSTPSERIFSTGAACRHGRDSSRAHRLLCGNCTSLSMEAPHDVRTNEGASRPLRHVPPKADGARAINTAQRGWFGQFFISSASYASLDPERKPRRLTQAPSRIYLHLKLPVDNSPPSVAVPADAFRRTYPFLCYCVLSLALADGDCPHCELVTAYGDSADSPGILLRDCASAPPPNPQSSPVRPLALPAWRMIPPLPLFEPRKPRRSQGRLEADGRG